MFTKTYWWEVIDLRRTQKTILVTVLLGLLVLAAGCSQAPAPAPRTDLILATTTSTQDSGILDVLIPAFEAKNNYLVKTLSVGTGAALELGNKGEADVLLTHAPASEQALVDSGAVVNRQLVMHNDFILVGPAADPAQIRGTGSPSEALGKIAASAAVFVSRGDDSGTHKMEKNLWKAVNVTPSGTWYQESGSGMGQTLAIASEKGGYTLTDRATYLAQKANLQLEILVEGDKSLLNIYHVMQVNKDKHPKEVADKINTAGAEAFVEFMVGAEAQEIISDFGVDKFGQPLFFPDAGKDVNQLGQ